MQNIKCTSEYVLLKNARITDRGQTTVPLVRDIALSKPPNSPSTNALIQRRGGRGPKPLENYKKYMVLCSTGPDPLKIISYEASITVWPSLARFAGVLMTARL